MVLLGSRQQLDAHKEIIWIIYIMDALELCFLWNRRISGRRYAFSTSSASAKSIAHGCFEANSFSIQNGFFNITGFDPTLPLAMELSMTNATWQWVHTHRTHWSQYVAYHSKAASLWNDIWETLQWCQLQSNIAGVWSDIRSNQLIPVNLRITCDTVLPRAVIHRLEIGVDINFCFSLLHQLTTGLEVIGSPSTPNWSFSRRDNLTEQVGKTGTCLVYAPCAA